MPTHPLGEESVPNIQPNPHCFLWGFESQGAGVCTTKPLTDLADRTSVYSDLDLGNVGPAWAFLSQLFCIPTLCTPYLSSFCIFDSNLLSFHGCSFNWLHDKQPELLRTVDYGEKNAVCICSVRTFYTSSSEEVLFVSVSSSAGVSRVFYAFISGLMWDLDLIHTVELKANSLCIECSKHYLPQAHQNKGENQQGWGKIVGTSVREGITPSWVGGGNTNLWMKGMNEERKLVVLSNMGGIWNRFSKDKSIRWGAGIEMGQREENWW